MKRGVQAEGLSAYLNRQPRDAYNDTPDWFCPYLWPSQILLGGVIHDEHIRWLHELFLHAGWRDEYVVLMLDGQTTASSSHPAMAVELVAELADVVCWV